MPERSRIVLSTVLTVVLSLAIGYVLFRFIQWMVHQLWTQIPAETFGGQTPWFYLLGLPLVAGVLVAFLRRGSDGHSPLNGLSTAPVGAKDYPYVILAILATLAGGLVLGPEVALISTGSVIGGVIASKVPGADLKRGALIGAFSALAALAIEPLRTGSIDLGEGYQFSGQGLFYGAVAGLGTALVLALVRLLARGITQARGGDKPVVWQLALGGLVVGGIALGYQAWVGEPVDLVLTSGEQLIKPLVGLTSVGLIVATVAAKSLAYAVSMGTGFRGGPYFPAMFAGAGIGAVVALWAGAPTQGPGLAGVTAGVIFLAKPKWLITVLLALGIGLVLGGPVMMGVALVGGLAGKIVPRLVEPAVPADAADDEDDGNGESQGESGNDSGPQDPAKVV